MDYAYYNGFFGKFSEINIPLSDRSVFFGDGVYDAAIGHDGKIFLEDAHINRFLCNIKKLGLPFFLSESELSKILHELIERSGFRDFFLYFQCTGNLPERLHAPRDKTRSNLLATVKPYTLPSKEKEIHLVTFPDIRQGFCNIKTLNLLGSVLASEHAASMKCDEAVFVKGERVTECAHSNILIVSNEKLLTHPCDEKILPGITREKVLLSAKKRGIDVLERPFSLSELFSADDVIITSTSKLALRAKTLDGVEISKKGSFIGDAIIDDMFKCYVDFC